MKLRITTLIVIMLTATLLIVGGITNSAYTKINGAPSACCGSIAHTLTCTDCHSGGPNTVQMGWITSTIPASGYVPGTTYTVTASASYSGRGTFGFEATCENASGAKKGTFIITNASTTKTISNGVYVTHTSGGISGTPNSHTWSFNWTAPAAGTGTVTFYGAFLCANGNGSDNGDATYKSHLAATEAITTGIADNSVSSSSFVSVYPNPVSECLNVSYKVDHQSKVIVELYGINGNLIREFMNEEKAPGEYQNSFSDLSDVAKGSYLLCVNIDNTRSVKKILIQ